MRRERAAAAGLFLATISVGGSAGASAPSTKTFAPAAGGLDAVEVVVDTAAGVLKTRRCKTHDCAEQGAPVSFRTTPLGIEPSRLDTAGATATVVPIGEGRYVVHVRIADMQRKDLAFEAIVAGNADAPIFAGLTGYTKGDDGDRSGDVVQLYDRGDGSKFVILAEIREDKRICGQTATPLSPRGLDPKTMQLFGATLQRIDKAAQGKAIGLAATNQGSAPPPPLARLLSATGGSAGGEATLTDGRTDTTWNEKRPGDGHGEFATMHARAAAPIVALTFAMTPSPAKAGGAAPRRFFIATGGSKTDAKLFHVTMPEDAWLKPGNTYVVDLPAPVKTDCVAVVLDEAYGRSLANPEVTIAEVAALTKFDVDHASLDDVAKELSGARRDEAAAILENAGEPGLAAVAAHWDSLDPGGRLLAVDIAASSGGCTGAGAELLTRALADKDEEVRKRAHGTLERCGKKAAPALAAAVRSEDEARRAAAAKLFASIDPADALDPVAEQLGLGSGDTRRVIRAAFSRAAKSASPDRLFALLKKNLPPAARLDLLRALGSKLPELRPDSAAAIADVLRGSPDMPTRWLVAAPLAELARAPDAKDGELTRLAELARRDPEPAVRAQAVKVAEPIAALAPTIVAAASDPEPRVREAAMLAIKNAKLGPGAVAAASALAKDEWTFVRVAAAEALGAASGDARSQAALAEALADKSWKVRAAALEALGKLHAVAHAKQIRQRLGDAKEDVEVRALAARTLGDICAREATDDLTELALLSRSPVDEADERIGVAAIGALASLHPRDIEKRLAPLRAKGVRMPVRRAADQAIADTGVCR